MMRAYKYRLYPNKEQEARLLETLETCRRLYNDALAARIDAYKSEGKNLSYVEQAHHLVLTKNEWQKRVYSHVLQDALRRLDKTYCAFFAARKAGRAHGFPRFKANQRYNSFRFPATGFKVSADKSRLYLSKIGDVRIVQHRETEGIIKTCSIVQECGQWFAVLTCDAPPSVTLSEFPAAIVGIDVGLHHFAALSTGEIINNPRHFRTAEKKLARLQRRLSRKKKGSANRQKARLKVARAHRKIKNQRADFLHKTSRRLASTYGTLVFEKLSIKGMVRNRYLSKSIHDAAWSKFITLTTYKAESAGGSVKLVDPRNTSQDCSNCGGKVPKSLSVRIHSCPSCGLVLDRDENAARNIAARAT